MSRRSHAETVDAATSRWVLDNITYSPDVNWNDILTAMQAFGNLKLAQMSDRLEDWGWK